MFSTYCCAFFHNCLASFPRFSLWVGFPFGFLENNPILVKSIFYFWTFETNLLCLLYVYYKVILVLQSFNSVINLKRSVSVKVQVHQCDKSVTSNHRCHKEIGWYWITMPQKLFFDEGIQGQVGLEWSEISYPRFHNFGIDFVFQSCDDADPIIRFHGRSVLVPRFLFLYHRTRILEKIPR